jgi:hypothetical protein
LVKAGRTKEIVVAYSPIVYQVLKKIIPKNGLLERSRYVVGTLDGLEMAVNKFGGTKARQFYANSLKKVASDETDYDMSMQQAVQLSGTDWKNNDTYLGPYKG